MTATILEKPWDFSNVLDLVNSLQPFASERGHFDAEEAREDEHDIEKKDNTNVSHGLGDFSRVFQYLGTPVSSPAFAFAVHTPLLRRSERYNHGSIVDYVSDGATYFKGSANQDNNAQDSGQNGAEQQATETVSDGSAAPDTPSLTKTQRRKKNRKERREKEAVLAAGKAAKNTTGAVSESEADVVSRTAPDTRASTHGVTTPPSGRYTLRQRDASGRAITENAKDPLLDIVNTARQTLDAAKKAESNAVINGSHTTPSKTSEPVVPYTRPREQSHPVRLSLPSASVSTSTPQVPRSVQPWPQATPGAGATHFVTSTVQPLSDQAARPAYSYQHPVSNQNMSRTKPKHIEPKTVRSGEDRHWALLTKLMKDFTEDRKHLLSPMNLTTHNNDSKGIHVFVDASNIFIGFNEQLRRSRGISLGAQIPPVNLSFDALALLMERRRPVAKRVLVGSMPHLPAFDKAKAVGYECNILEKVYKARELTERQIYFKEYDRNGFRRRAKAPPVNNVATVNGGSGSGSGSETNATPYAPPRMIEQGVDEILHLKILESVVDTDVPGTIVLATGDAAQAEYSQGFMAMAERALKKGWTVELVSWSKTISAMYTKREWVQAWGERFRIVTLDSYAEELLDM